MKRVGDLPFDFNRGACNTFPISGSEKIVLCFDADKPKDCKRYAEFTNKFLIRNF